DSIAGVLVADNYIITVTDSNGCTAIDNTVIIEPTLLVSTINTSVNVSCNGGNDGQATVTTSGGTVPYSYLWSSGGITATETNLIAGTYTVTTTDSLGCSDLDTIVITEPAAPLSAITSSIDNLCFGDNTGSGIVTALGGTAPYTYLWSTIPSVNDSVNGLLIGTYIVTVTDTLGCTVTDSIVLNEPTILTISFSQTNVSCNGGNDGEAIVTPLGGTIPYSYAWSNSDADSIAESLSSGGYTLIVTDGNGCTENGGITITQPDLLAISITSTNVSCNAGNDGQAIVTPIGGTIPYTYVWSNADPDSIAGGLVAGNYGVTVTDSLGCVIIDSVEITEPLQLNFTFSQTNVSCNAGVDGQGSVIVTGGTLPYNYLWSNGDTDSLNTGLVVGTYILTVTDGLGCVLVDSIIITEPTQLTSTTTSTDILCFGANTGGAGVQVSGGTLNYSYSWDNGQGGDSLSSLLAGTYIVTITDGNNCTIVDSVILTEPAAGLSLSLTQTNVSCNGGSDGEVIVTPLGGTIPYTYLWSNADPDSIAGVLVADNYIITVTDTNGCIAIDNTVIIEPTLLVSNIVNVVNTFCGLPNGAALSTVTGGTLPYSISWSNGATANAISGVLSAGYTVLITDTNGCIQVDSVFIDNVPSPKVNITDSSDVLCFGGNTGTAVATPSFGIPGYNYMWAPSGETIANPTSLSAGTHIVTLTDGNGCNALDTVVIGEPTQLAIVVDTIITLTCFGSSDGEILVLANGGIPGYDYSWSNGDSSANIIGLASGIYTVTLTDTNSCAIDQTVVVTEPALLNVSIISFADEKCIGSNDGSSTITHTGGIAPYSYSWNSTPIQTSLTATNLSPGSYTVDVTDSNGCIASEVVIIGSPLPVITNGINDVILCYGDSINLVASASGGNGGYLFFWGSGIGLGNPITVAPTNTTVYLVNAIDQNGCVGTSEFVQVGVEALFQNDINVILNSPICQGSNTMVSATVNNTNTGPVTYSWNNALPNTSGPFQVTPTSPTTYVVTVTNQCGVSVIDSATVLFKPLPNVSFFGNGIDCAPVSVSFFDLSNTSVDAIVSWFWNFGDGGSSIDQNPVYNYNTAGNYDVSLTVTTNDGCENDTTLFNQVIVHPDPIADFTADALITDLEFPTVNFSNLSLGGAAYFWSFNDGDTTSLVNPSHTFQDTGTFYVNLLVTNQFGCTNDIDVPIVINPWFTIEVPNAFTPNPSGPNGGKYDVNSLLNNVFFPYTEFVEEYKLMIFNRWGELIFESDDLAIGWDGYFNGILSQQDVYVWKI
ncbi:MAG: PKD domain-containing protein, partial [Vicingaceae bacterium]